MTDNTFTPETVVDQIVKARTDPGFDHSQSIFANFDRKTRGTVLVWICEAMRYMYGSGKDAYNQARYPWVDALREAIENGSPLGKIIRVGEGSLNKPDDIEDARWRALCLRIRTEIPERAYFN